jgi:hypothetical protein
MASSLVHKKMDGQVIAHDIHGDGRYKQRHAWPETPITMCTLPVRTVLRNVNIVRSGEKVPEEFCGLRPGSQEEVGTFGQHLALVANHNYLWCSQARGEKNPNAGTKLTLVQISF